MILKFEKNGSTCTGWTWSLFKSVKIRSQKLFLSKTRFMYSRRKFNVNVFRIFYFSVFDNYWGQWHKSAEKYSGMHMNLFRLRGVTKFESHVSALPETNCLCKKYENPGFIQFNWRLIYWTLCKMSKYSFDAFLWQH